MLVMLQYIPANSSRTLHLHLQLLHFTMPHISYLAEEKHQKDNIKLQTMSKHERERGGKGSKHQNDYVLHVYFFTTNQEKVIL